MALVWREDEAGILECIDTDTGHVVERQKIPPSRLTKAEKASFYNQPGKGRGVAQKVDENGMIWVMNASGEKFLVPSGFNPQNLPDRHRPAIWTFNPITANHIVENVLNGRTIREIGATMGFPPATTIFKWIMKYPEFRAEVTEARKMRAEVFHDKVIEIADNVKPATVNEDRLKSELYKWGAQVGDPDAFGNRIKHAGDKNAPLGFIIDTGVPLSDDQTAPAIEAEHHPVTEDHLLPGPEEASPFEEVEAEEYVPSSPEESHGGDDSGESP